MTAAVGDDAEARVGTGEVDSLRTVFEIATHHLPPNVGLAVEASGQAGGVRAERGARERQEAGGTVNVTPDFSAAGATRYELILLAREQVILRLPGLSGLAGQISLGAGDDPQVEWYAGHTVRLSEFNTGFGFRIDGVTYAAEHALFRAEDPTLTGEHIASVTWRAVDMDQFLIKEVDFELEAWRYRLSGPFHVSPTSDGLGTFNPVGGGPWQVEVAVNSASTWSLGAAPSALALEASLRFEATSKFSDGASRTPWQVELERRASEPVSPLAWRLGFDFHDLGPAAVKVLDDGVEVMTWPSTSGESVYFDPAAFEVSMDLSGPAGSSTPGPAMSLTFAAPIQITPIDGGMPVTGDQIVAVPSGSAEGLVLQSLSDLLISGQGQGQVNVGQLAVQLEEKPSATFGCGSLVSMDACKPADTGDSVLKYRILVESPPGQDTCFNIISPTQGSSAFGNLVPIPPSGQSSPFSWQGCVRGGTSCYVGFTAKAPLPSQTSQGNIVSNFALSGNSSGQPATIYNRDALKGLLTTSLPNCSQPPQDEIQLCDDDLIFTNGFECKGTDAWSFTLSGD
ncbi:MAG: hypothetical protein AAGM22_26070 [Acidobacteriota bacterium]